MCRRSVDSSGVRPVVAVIASESRPTSPSERVRNHSLARWTESSKAPSPAAMRASSARNSLSRGEGPAVVEADVEPGGRLGRNDVEGRIADIDADHLEIGRLKAVAAFVEPRLDQPVEDADEPRHRVVGKMRIGGMALAPDDADRRRQAAAPADLDHVAEAGPARSARRRVRRRSGGRASPPSRGASRCR